jgi:hypothetical protein
MSHSESEVEKGPTPAGIGPSLFLGCLNFACSRTPEGGMGCTLINGCKKDSNPRRIWAFIFPFRVQKKKEKNSFFSAK